MAVQIVSNQIVSNAITTAKVNDGAITPAKADLSTTWAFTAAPTYSSDPTADNQLVRKAYVDNLVQGLGWLEAVRVRVTSNVDLSGPGAALDGVTLANGDRVLLTNQTTGSENGIYDFAGASSAMTRSDDADTFAKLDHAAVFVKEGNSADTGYVQSASLSSFSSQNWVQFTSSANARGAGDGLNLSGNNLEVEAANSSISVSASGVSVGTIADANISNGSISTAKLTNNSISITAGTGLSGGGSVALGSSVGINVSGITNAMIDAGAAIADSKLAQITDPNKVAGSAVQLAGSSAIEDSTGLRLKAAVAGTGLTLSSGQVLDVSGITNAEIAGGASIADSKLATISSSEKVSGSAVQLADTSALEDSTGLRLKAGTAGTGLTMTNQVLNVGGLTNAELSGSAGITDANLAQITSNNKVAGSAVQLAGSSAIENDGGLKIAASLAGSGLTMTGQAMSLTNNSITVTAGNGTEGGGSVALGGSVQIGIADNGVTTARINAAAVTAPKIGATFAQKVFASHSATNCNLDGEIATANQCKAVLVFRNGLALENTSATGGTNNSVDTFSVTQTDAGNSGNSTVVLGAAPSNDTIMVWYFH